MNIEEMEVKIKEEKAKLAILEEAYDKETEESKYQKIEFKIARKEEVIDKLIDRQQVLLDKEQANEEKGEPIKNEEEEEEEDEATDVCPGCGGDLVLVGKDDTGVTDIYECEKCGELYLDE